MIDVTSKVIAITGAASGMGLATAKRLYAGGASLSLTDIRKEALELAVSEIEAHSPSKTAGNSILTAVVDIRESDQVDAWISKTVAYFGRLDGAANIAGVLGKSFGVGEVWQISDEEFDFITATNFNGVFNCMRAQLRVMAKGGSIVNASSMTGLEGHPFNAVYSATKHAVIGLTKSAAGEVGSRGIRVNAVAPGKIENPMVASIGALDEGKLDSVFARVPLARMGQSDEVANVFAFLLSDEASYVTGSTYVVDGGALC